MKIQKIYVGGWFQRTVLHLVEIYDFLKGADSPLDLDKEKLNNFRDMLKIDSLEMKIGDLEYINIISKYGIEFKIYEDGLIMLSKNPELSIEDDIKSLTSYYEEKLSPGLSYIFSLGAPMPKELADIKTIYPYFLVLDKADRKDIESLFSNFKQEKYFEIKRKSFEIYRGDKLYIINNISEKFSSIEKFVEEQTFIREFNGQLHRYLNLHRVIWERIAEVKEKGEIRGRDVGSFADKVESYSKTINLIETRIKQMGTYIRTREAIIKNNKELAEFIDVLQFKHEALSNTLKYIMEIWQMTKNYVNSAINLFTSIQAKSTENSVTNLAIITSMGVGATLISLFTQKKPNFTLFGALYFFILIFIGYSTNQIMKMIYRNRRYKIRDIEVAKDIK